MTPRQTLDLVAELFLTEGHRRYDAPEARPDLRGVDVLSHSLQCAQLAEWAHADAELVAAALLHDLGHLLDARRWGLGWRDDLHRAAAGEGAGGGRGGEEASHATRAVHLLRQAFPDEVTEPVRLHVQAKRYLVGFDRRYLEALSPAALHGLSLQGGPMTAMEMRRFELDAHAAAAIKLRIWDDLAQHPGKATPPLSHYLGLLEDLVLQTERQRARQTARSLPLAIRLMA
jgi:predicted HD phosphohydrolase